MLCAGNRFGARQVPFMCFQYSIQSLLIHGFNYIIFDPYFLALIQTRFQIIGSDRDYWGFGNMILGLHLNYNLAGLLAIHDWHIQIHQDILEKWLTFCLNLSFHHIHSFSTIQGRLDLVAKQIAYISSHQNIVRIVVDNQYYL